MHASSDRGYLGLTIECNWCRCVKVLPTTTPEGWRAIFDPPSEVALYCCPYCVPMAFPEHADE